MEFLQMSGDLSAAGCAPVEVIVGEKECRGIRAVGIALELGLRGLERVAVSAVPWAPLRKALIANSKLIAVTGPLGLLHDGARLLGVRAQSERVV